MHSNIDLEAIGLSFQVTTANRRIGEWWSMNMFLL